MTIQEIKKIHHSEASEYFEKYLEELEYTEDDPSHIKYMKENEDCFKEWLEEKYNLYYE